MENRIEKEKVLVSQTENVGWFYIVISLLLLVVLAPLLCLWALLFELVENLFFYKKKNKIVKISDLDLQQYFGST